MFCKLFSACFGKSTTATQEAELVTRPVARPHLRPASNHRSHRPEGDVYDNRPQSHTASNNGTTSDDSFHRSASSACSTTEQSLPTTQAERRARRQEEREYNAVMRQAERAQRQVERHLQRAEAQLNTQRQALQRQNRQVQKALARPLSPELDAAVELEFQELLKQHQA